MSSLSIPFSFAILNSMQKISITKRVAVHRHAKINGHSARIPAHCTPRVVSHLSAMMVDGTIKDVRPLTTSFTPNIWGDIFSTFSFDNQAQQKYSEEIEALKKDARGMLMAVMSTKLMILIDKLERLGIAYHFETEIDHKLKQVYDSAEDEEEDCDLFTTALRFRLLRQHQYQVSCNAFVKFVDKDNKLKESLSSDVEGLLSLYEAAHVRIHDENVLEEAVAFTTHHLRRMLPQLESPLKEKEVYQALKFPLHKSPTIITLPSYIDIYENDDSRDELLLRLAKLNFNFMQNIFRNELFQITTWNIDEIDLLPDYLKLVYKFIMSLSEEFEREAEKQGKSYVVPYYIEELKQVGRGYAQEQKWIKEQQNLPSFEEYMIHTRITTLLYVSFIALVPLIKSSTKETIDWVLSDSEIFVATSDIVRLSDDLFSHQREGKDGTMLTPMDYYMRDKEASMQDAEFAFKELLEDKWKNLNASWVSCDMIPKEIVVQFVNIARMCAVIYMNEEDNFTNPEKNMAPVVTALFLDSKLI